MCQIYETCFKYERNVSNIEEMFQIKEEEKLIKEMNPNRKNVCKHKIDICRHSAIEEEEEGSPSTSGLRFRVRGCPPLNR